MCATSLGKICASDHAMNAAEEMSALNRDLKQFFDAAGTEYPVWKALEAETGEYLNRNRSVGNTLACAEKRKYRCGLFCVGKGCGDFYCHRKKHLTFSKVII